MRTETIIYNGVKMSVEECKQILKEKNKTVKKPKRKKRENVISDEIAQMIKSMRFLKSLSSYYRNGYRQWGTIVSNGIFGKKEISAPFTEYVKNMRELEALLTQIVKLKNNKSVFQYIYNISYKLDDIKNNILQLGKGITQTNILTLYGNHECLNGSDRRLGLYTLINRSWSATKKIEENIKILQEIANKGKDPLDYY